MRTNLMGVAVAAVACALVSGIAVAQKSEEVQVEASRIVKTSVGRDVVSGALINDIALSYGVSYADLDLASSAGASELEKRVSNAALAACKEISRESPNAEPSDAVCAKRAVDKAMVKVHELVAAASKAPAK
jgi:UrcA family protein